MMKFSYLYLKCNLNIYGKKILIVIGFKKEKKNFFFKLSFSRYQKTKAVGNLCPVLYGTQKMFVPFPLLIRKFYFSIFKSSNGQDFQIYNKFFKINYNIVERAIFMFMLSRTYQQRKKKSYASNAVIIFFHSLSNLSLIKLCVRII